MDSQTSQMKFGSLECGTVLRFSTTLPATCTKVKQNVYKVCCCICRNYIAFEQFIVHYQKHLERDGIQKKQKDTDDPNCQRNINTKRSEQQQRIAFDDVDYKAEISMQQRDDNEKVINNNNNNKTEEGNPFECVTESNSNDNNSTDDSNESDNDDDDENFEDFLWDIITDSDTSIDTNEAKSTATTTDDGDDSYDKDEPLVDIQTLITETSSSNAINKLVTPTVSVRMDEIFTENEIDKSPTIFRSDAKSDDVMDDDDDADSYSWDIDSCQSDYPEINAINRHQELVNPIKWTSVVKNDKTTTATLSSFAPSICAICDMQFTSHMGLSIHMRTHQTKRTSKITRLEYKCDDCGKVLRSERGLQTHRYKHTGVHCDVCNKQFTSVSNMDRHKLMHAGAKNYQCTHCNECFYTVSEMKNHSAKHTGMRRVMCELCGKPCRDRGVLAQHMLRHTGERPVKCEQCGKAFYSNHDLKEHVVIHSAARPFVCECCGATFQRKKSLRVHKKIHSTAPCTEECTVCGKKFAKPSGLLSHMRVHDAVYGLSYPVGGWVGGGGNT